MLTAHILKNTESVTKKTKQNKKTDKKYMYIPERNSKLREVMEKTTTFCALIVVRA